MKAPETTLRILELAAAAAGPDESAAQIIERADALLDWLEEETKSGHQTPVTTINERLAKGRQK